MTRRSKIFSIFIALIMIIGAISVVSLTASAANVTVGSSLFINNKNVTVTGTTDGIAMKINQKEFASLEYKETLPMDNFSATFKIIDDNFESLLIAFISMYDEETLLDDYDNATGSITEAERKALVQPEKVKNTIELKKTSSGLNVWINGVDKNNIGSSFKGAEFTISYEIISATLGKLTVKCGSDSKSENVAKIVNDEATMKIEFKDIKKVEFDSAKQANTLLLKEIAYNYNLQEDSAYKTYKQEFTGSTTPDTSKPIVKVNKKLLTSAAVDVPVGTQYKIPIYGLDIAKSLSTLSFDATVKYYESAGADGETVNVSSLGFDVTKTTGYYEIEKITVRDGTHTVTFGENDSTFDNIDGLTMPIKVVPVERDAGEFKFQISDDYKELFEGLNLKGGSDNKIVFPTPQSYSTLSATATGFKSLVNGSAENRHYITYQLWYKTINDSPETWTKYSSTGLEFTATSETTYQFRIEAIDRQGRAIRSDTIITMSFYDSQAPIITINGFPTERIINEQFTIPTASTTDDFDSSPTKTIKLYHCDENGVKGEEIELESGNSFTPEELGYYLVVYNAKDKNEHEAVEVERIFKVVEAEVVRTPFFKLDTLSIVFLVIGSVALLGIVGLLFVKPKEKAE